MLQSNIDSDPLAALDFFFVGRSELSRKDSFHRNWNRCNSAITFLEHFASSEDILRSASLEKEVPYTSLKKNLEDMAEILRGRLDNNPHISRDDVLYLMSLRSLFRKFKPIQEKPDYVLSMVHDMTRKGRLSEKRFRLTVELSEAVSKNKYCIFNTLTVKEEYYSDVWKTGSSYFNNYIKRVNRLVEEGEHSYFAVVERGSKTARLHIHVLHIFDSMPSGCVDPNAGLLRPTNREVVRFKSLWDYGYSSPLFVIFSGCGWTSRSNWRWPVERNKKGIFVPCDGSASKVVSYITKYVVKQDNDSSEFGGYVWRTRMSRNFGMKKLNQWLMTLSLEEALNLIHFKPPTSSKVPFGLAKRSCRLMLAPILASIHPGLVPCRESLLERLRNTTSEVTIPSDVSFGNIQIKISSGLVIYDSFEKWYFSVVSPLSSVSITGTSL